ncbi:pilus assembly FimT family protein [Psychrobacter alimentarius]|uniref:pilus assembly FimT family protein n=1 Tax=Psychrobacter alimentarius TaxID=261164 RepID=UPI003FD15CE7
MNASANNLPLKRQTTSSGFTLIELMVTIAVLAIIVSIAAPSFSNQLAKGQINKTFNLIQTSIEKAKAESTVSRNNITWSYDNTVKRITLSNNGNVVESYNLSSNSLLTFTPATATSLIINQEGFITLIDGNAASVNIVVSDTKSNSVTKKVRINTKRAFECSGATC